MIRQFAKNGYTVYLATAKDEKKYTSVYEGNYYIYFSSDIRDFGLSCSYAEFECVTLEEAKEQIESCGTYARAKEICEEYSTCVSAEEIETMQNILSASDSEEEAIEKYEALEDEDMGTIVNVISIDIPFKDSTISAEDRNQACIFDFLATYMGEKGYKVLSASISDNSTEYYSHVGNFTKEWFDNNANPEFLKNVHALIIEDAESGNVIDMFYGKPSGLLAHRPQI